MVTGDDLVARRERTKGLHWGATIVGKQNENDKLVVYQQRGVNGEFVFCGLCGSQPKNTQHAVKKHRHHRKCSICHEPAYRPNVRQGGGFPTPCRGCVKRSSSSLFLAVTTAPVSTQAHVLSPAKVMTSASTRLQLNFPSSPSPNRTPPRQMFPQPPATTTPQSAPALAPDPYHLFPSHHHLLSPHVPAYHEPLSCAPAARPDVGRRHTK